MTHSTDQIMPVGKSDKPDRYWYPNYGLLSDEHMLEYRNIPDDMCANPYIDRDSDWERCENGLVKLKQTGELYSIVRVNYLENNTQQIILKQVEHQS